MTQETKKTNLSLVVLGAPRHGKTTLCAALEKMVKQLEPAEPQPHLIPLPQRPLPDEANWQWYEYGAKEVNYGLVEYLSYAHQIRYLIHGWHADLPATLVVSALEGPTAETEELVWVDRQAGILDLVVFINKVDQLDDPGRLAQIEGEVRDMLTRHHWPGEQIPVVQGSALRALESAGDLSRSDPATAQLWTFLDSASKFTLPNLRERPFRMTIWDVFDIKERGIVVTGPVDRGTLRVGEMVEVVGLRGEVRSVRVKGIEMFMRTFAETKAGDNVALLLDGIERADVEPGQVVAAPATISAHRECEALAYLFLSEGMNTASPASLLNELRLFWFRTGDIPGTARVVPSDAPLLPGAHCVINLQLKLPVAMETGTRFAIRDEQRNVGVGVVTRIFSDPA